MEQFNKLRLDGKSFTFLHNILLLKVVELNKTLFLYNEKVLGNKADLVLFIYAVCSLFSDERQ